MPSPEVDRDSQDLPALPRDLEDRFYEIVLEKQGDERRALLEELVARSGEWREPLLERAAAMTEGDRVLGHAREPLGATRIPQQIDKYRILDLLGEGGFGAVYRAEQHEPVHRIVALKVLHPRRLDPRSQFRFQAEGQTLARMQHASIAQIYDAGSTEEGLLFFAMELVDGESITRWCDRNGSGLDERLDLFLAVCSGVQHAHQRGVVHRDLKPGNVLVKTEGNHPVPKVIDFGVAKVLQEDDADNSVTRDGAMIGTPGYMSPEQAAGESIDTRTDVYALGVLLYELLTGDLPFARRRLLAGSVSEAAKIVQEEEPRKLGTAVREAGTDDTKIAANRGRSVTVLLRELSSDLEWIVRRALAKNPDHRYASVSDLIADVERYQKKEPVAAREHAALYLVRRFVARHRVGVAVSMTFVAATIFVIIGLLWLLDERDIARESAVERGNIAVLNEYAAHLAAARAALQLGDPENAKRHLDAAAPLHRGWEWDYLMSLCDTSVAVIKTEEGSTIDWLDEHRACLISYSGTVQIWDTRTEVLEDCPLTLPGFKRAYWDPARRHLFALVDNLLGVVAVDPETWTTTRLFTAKPGGPRRTTDIRRCALAPDERTIAISQNNGAITLLDATAERAPRQLCIAPSHSVAMMFTPNGDSLIIGLNNGSVQIRSAHDGTLTADYPVHRNGIRSMALDADGTTLFAAGGNKLHRLDLSSGKLLQRIEVGGVIFQLELSQHERVLYGSGGSGGTQLIAWSADTLELIGRHHGHQEVFRDFDLHPDGSRIASTTLESARIWRATPQPAVIQLDAGFDTNDLGVSTDGEAFAICNSAGVVKLWNARTCALEFEMQCEAKLYGCAPTADTIYVGGEKLLAIERSTRAVREADHGGDILSRLCIDQQERWLAAGTFPWGQIRIWRLPNLELVQDLEVKGGTDKIVFDESRGSFLVACGDQTLRWVDPVTGTITAEPQPGIGSWALAQNSGAIAAGEDRLSVRTADATTFTSIDTATRVMSVAFSPDMQRIVTGTYNSLVTVWDRDGTELLVLDAPKMVTEIAFVAGGERIVGMSQIRGSECFVMVWGVGLP